MCTQGTSAVPAPTLFHLDRITARYFIFYYRHSIMFLSRWLLESGIDRLLAPIVEHIGGEDDALSAALHAAALSAASSSNYNATMKAETLTKTNTLNSMTHQQVEDGGGGDDDEVDGPVETSRRRENDFWEFVAPRSRRDPPASPSSSLLLSNSITNVAISDAATAELSSSSSSHMTNSQLPDDNGIDNSNDNHHHHCEENDDEEENDEIENSNDENERIHLQYRVLHAAYETALTNSGPTFLWEKKHDLFSLCGAPPSKQSTTSTTAMNANGTKKMSKNVKKLHKLLLADTTQSYMHARTANMSSSLGLPDGYNMLHAACHVGNVDIVTYLLEHHVRLVYVNYNTDDDNNNDDDDDDEKGGEKTMLDLNEVDMQGKTALHIASDRGHVDIVLLLREAYNKQVEESSALPLSTKLISNEEEENIVGGLAKEGEDVDEDGKHDNDNNNDTVSTNMANLSISATPRATSLIIPKTPGSSGNHNTNSKRKSITPTFSGRHAPVDLSGKTPLGYAATSPVPKTRTNRVELEKILYSHGDRSIFGHGGVAERTPPKLRCGPTVQYSPIRLTASASSSTRNQQQRPISSLSSSIIVPTTTTTGGYLSPNPRAYLSPKTPRSASNGTTRTPPRSTGGGGSRRTNGKTPSKSAISSISNYATPFQSPHPIIHEEEIYHTGIAVEEQQQQQGEMTTDVDKSSVVRRRSDNRRNLLQWGVSEMNGWRIDMEDKILVELLIDNDNPSSSNDIIGLFGVFDGHGDGGHASNYIASNIWTKLHTQKDWMTAVTLNNNNAAQHHDNGVAADMFSSALTSACYELDDELRKDTTRPKDGGTTAIMALVCNDQIIVANVGDSRCILVKKNKTTATMTDAHEEEAKKKENIVVIPMSEDHKPNLPNERARIESAGLTIQSDIVPVDSKMIVNNDDNSVDESIPPAAISSTATIVVHRVRKSNKNLLGVSRAFGDYDYKSNTELSSLQQAVVCTPEIIIRERVDNEDMYLILACDGIWDVMTNEDVGTFVARRVKEEMQNLNSSSGCNELLPLHGELLASVGDDLLAACLEAGSRDNMSVLIVAFPASGLAHVHPLCVTPSLATIGNNSNPLAVDDATVRVIDFD